MRVRGTAAIAPLAMIAAIALVASCGASGSHGGGSGGAASTGRAAPSPTFVVIGDSASAPVVDSIPVGESWPQWFFRTALPRDTVFVNLATTPASAHVALRVQVPVANRLHAAVAAILIGFADVDEREPTDVFEEVIDRIVTGLRAGRPHTILLATLPDELGAVSSYNRVIAAVARRYGAVLVDLVPLRVTFVRDPESVTAVPDRASQRAIGAAFASAYRAATSRARP